MLTLCSNSAVAQTIPDPPEDVQACKTNLGPEGHWIYGLPGMVYAPTSFDDVRIEGINVAVASAIRNGLGVLIFAAPTTKEASKTTKALVEFSRNDGTVVHQCSISIQTYDPHIQNLEQLQIGDCNLKLVAGLRHLIVGHFQVWETPQDAQEIAVGPYAVMDNSILSKRMFMALGNSPGVAVVMWAQKKQDGTYIANLCPFKVSSASEMDAAQVIENKELCKDISDAPMRLSVGQTVTMQVPKGDGRAFVVDDYSIGSTSIADGIGFDKTNKALIVKGISPGTTTIVLISETDGTQARACEVQVK